MYDYCLPQHNLRDSLRTKEKLTAVVQFGVHGVLNDVDAISTYSSARQFQIFVYSYAIRSISENCFT
jgi:hypothetical protein